MEDSAKALQALAGAVKDDVAKLVNDTVSARLKEVEDATQDEVAALKVKVSTLEEQVSELQKKNE